MYTTKWQGLSFTQDFKVCNAHIIMKKIQNFFATRKVFLHFRFQKEQLTLFMQFISYDRFELLFTARMNFEISFLSLEGGKNNCED